MVHKPKERQRAQRPGHSALTIVIGLLKLEAATRRRSPSFVGFGRRRLLDAEGCDEPVRVFCGDRWRWLCHSALNSLGGEDLAKFRQVRKSVGDKDAIVLCICAEASFGSAALERPHSAKIISKMTLEHFWTRLSRHARQKRQRRRRAVPGHGDNAQ